MTTALPRGDVSLDPEWPAHITEFRPAQARAVEEVTAAFLKGARIVVVEAPTGAGKTPLAEGVRRNLNVSALYVCTDKLLQEQLRQTFPSYAKILMGRRNYTALDNLRDKDGRLFTAEDCDLADDSTGDVGALFDGCRTCTTRNLVRAGNAKHCSYCHPWSSCPYKLAKRAARSARLGCTNLSYLLTEANGPGEFSDWPLIIADECDRLEGALSQHISVSVSAARWKVFGLEAPVQGSAPQWAAWIESIALPAMREKVKTLHAETYDDEDHEPTEGQIKFLTGLKNLGKRLAFEVVPALRAWQMVAVADRQRGGVEFKPVRVRREAPDLLWRHADKWLLMSATVLDAERLLWTLGAEKEPWHFISVPSSFDVARRPVILSPVAQVTKRNPSAGKALAEALDRILKRHQGERILVHTVSHRLANELWTLLGGANHPRLVLLRPGGRDHAIAEYTAKKDGVLIAAGLERGVDFADDLCRVVVVAKCPWPDLGDPVVEARVAGRGAADRVEAMEGRDWYAEQALRTVVQATGRGMRHAGDSCTSYLLDQQLVRLLDLKGVPEWWREAVRAEPV
jgi:ATP-dependent DNA helicase DinG